MKFELERFYYIRGLKFFYAFNIAITKQIFTLYLVFCVL